LYPESPGMNLYVDQALRVTASERLARAGRFFGHVCGGAQVDTSARLWTDLIDHKKNLFVSGSQCASCEAFHLCDGYLRFVDSGFNCEPFLEVFLEIKAKAREMAQDLSEAGDREE